MSDLSQAAGKLSSLWHDVLGYFKGKAATSIASDARAFLADAEKIGTGLRGAAPDAPGLVSDVEKLVADGSALLVSRGLDLPALVKAGEDAKALFAQAEKAYADYCAAIALASQAPVVHGAPAA